MKTSDYNPSLLEIRFAHTLKSLIGEINSKMDGFTIFRAEDDLKQDNPFNLLQLLIKAQIRLSLTQTQMLTRVT